MLAIENNSAGACQARVLPSARQWAHWFEIVLIESTTIVSPGASLLEELVLSVAFLFQ
jgi:hypothetical protein